MEIQIEKCESARTGLRDEQALPIWCPIQEGRSLYALCIDGGGRLAYQGKDGNLPRKAVIQAQRSESYEQANVACVCNYHYFYRPARQLGLGREGPASAQADEAAARWLRARSGQAGPGEQRRPGKCDLADREKIRNTVLSYSHLFDERNFDEWKKLWTDDVVLEIVMPGVGTVRTHGLDTFWDLVAFLVTNGGSSYGWEAGTPIARG